MIDLRLFFYCAVVLPMLISLLNFLALLAIGYDAARRHEEFKSVLRSGADAQRDAEIKRLESALDAKTAVLTMRMKLVERAVAEERAAAAAP